MRDEGQKSMVSPRSGGVRPGAAGGSRLGLDASFGVDQVHRIRFTRDVFSAENPVLHDILMADATEPGRGPRRMIALIDDGVAAAMPQLAEQIAVWCDGHRDHVQLVEPAAIVTGGEAAKNDWKVFEDVVARIERAGICRQSYVFAIGGGAMLDAVGFAASAAHRGVRLVRFPTTTLAQDDAGIGVKNGINGFGKKNFIGTFGVPWAVINDESFLATQSDRDWRAGISEAVKVALLRDPALFELIVDSAPALRNRDGDALRPIVRRSAELHLDHIVTGGDPYEMLTARPLDFGHWAAHKLEQLSDYDLRHGEAVAIGLAIDVLYAQRVGTLDEASAERILGCLRDIGFTLFHPAMHDHAELLRGLQEFREHLGGALTITLLEKIGRPVDVHVIDEQIMVDTIAELERRAVDVTRS